MERSHDILDRSQINFRQRGFTSTDLRCSIIPCKTMGLTIGTQGHGWNRPTPVLVVISRSVARVAGR